jgi:hypothetical protein
MCKYMNMCVYVSACAWDVCGFSLEPGAVLEITNLHRSVRMTYASQRSVS